MHFFKKTGLALTGVALGFAAEAQTLPTQSFANRKERKTFEKDVRKHPGRYFQVDTSGLAHFPGAETTAAPHYNSTFHVTGYTQKTVYAQNLGNDVSVVVTETMDTQGDLSGNGIIGDGKDIDKMNVDMVISQLQPSSFLRTETKSVVLWNYRLEYTNPAEQKDNPKGADMRAFDRNRSLVIPLRVAITPERYRDQRLAELTSFWSGTLANYAGTAKWMQESNDRDAKRAGESLKSKNSPLSPHF